MKVVIEHFLLNIVSVIIINIIKISLEASLSLLIILENLDGQKMWVGMRCLASNDKKSRQHCNDWHHFAFLIINQSCKQAFGTLVIFQPHEVKSFPNCHEHRDMNFQEQVCLGNPTMKLSFVLYCVVAYGGNCMIEFWAFYIY